MGCSAAICCCWKLLLQWIGQEGLRYPAKCNFFLTNIFQKKKKIGGVTYWLTLVYPTITWIKLKSIYWCSPIVQILVPSKGCVDIGIIKLYFIKKCMELFFIIPWHCFELAHQFSYFPFKPPFPSHAYLYLSFPTIRKSNTNTFIAKNIKLQCNSNILTINKIYINKMHITNIPQYCKLINWLINTVIITVLNWTLFKLFILTGNVLYTFLQFQ